jgi:hypothetical protein
MAGVVVVFLKVFTMGGLYPGPVIGIIGEAVLVESAFTLTFSRAPGAVLGGALALAVNPLQMVLMTWVVAGPQAVQAALRATQSVAVRLGAPAVDGTQIVVVLMVVSGALGGLVGGVAWVVAGRVVRRLGRDR